MLDSFSKYSNSAASSAGIVAYMHKLRASLGFNEISCFSVLFGAFLFLASVGSYAAEIEPPKRVLVIYGNPDIGAWEQTFNQVVNRRLSAEFGIIVTPDFLSLINPSEDEVAAISESIRLRYQTQKLDLVIALFPEANSYLANNSEIFAPGTPRLFALPGTDVVDKILTNNSNVILNSAVQVAALNTIQLIPEILPDLDHLFVVGGASAGDKNYIDRVEKAINDSSFEPEVHSLSGLTPDALIATLKEAPENSASMMTTYDMDQTGTLLRTLDVTRLLSNQTSLPVFGMFDTLVGAGALGGNVSTPALYADRVVELSVAMLAGEPIERDVPSPSGYLFDGEQLNRFGIDRDFLPEGSEVVNDIPGLLQQYWWQFALGGIIFIVLVLFITALGESLRRRNKAEKERENSTAAMLEAQRIAHVGSWYLDLASNQATWSPELYHMQGLDPEVPPPKYSEHSERFTAESWECARSSLAHTIESGDPYEIELEMVKPDGKHGWMLAKGEVVRDASGFVIGVRGTALDITERHNASEQLRRAQKMEAVGQLTGGIAHDFNNILAIIMGNLELVKLGASGDKEILSDVDRALEGAARGTALIDKLLGFSRVRTVETSLTSVNQLIENMDDLLVKSLTVSVEIDTQLDPKLQPISVDAGDLEGAILNLALNARDAMPNGGRLTIETANKVLDAEFVRRHPEARLGEYTMLTVRDTGIGMTPEVREKALEPFFTTKAEGKGTGLGLSMVYGFVKRSGGFITLYSELGAGTSINIFLPSSRKVERMNSTTMDKEELPRGDETVLVVDDEEELTKLAAANLERLGYKTLTAFDGKSALELIKDKPNIDLLFSDVVMPGELDGYLLAIAAKKTRPTLKILLTSGFTKRKEDDISPDKLMIEELTRNLLRKPYSQAELARAVRYALDRVSTADRKPPLTQGQR